MAKLIPYLLSEKKEILEKVDEEIAHGSHSDPDRIFVNFDEKYIQAQLKELFLRLKKNYKVTAAWVHVLAPGAEHTMHNHSSIIGVIYLRIPDQSGNLILDRMKTFIQPRRDHFIMIPAREPHRITKNLSNRPRFALAFSLEEQ